LSCGSVFVLGIVANWLAAALLAFTIFFYAVVYTMWLKRRTPQNIVIGGAAGAFPPMIGWAAVTGAVSLESVVLFLIIFMWTPPHFWALALVKSDDFSRAGIPMLPVVAGEAATRSQILIYAALMAITGVVPSVLGFAGHAYAAIATVLGIAFVALSIRLYRDREGPSARRAAGQLFAFSIFYLFALYAALLVEHLVLGLLGTA
jgi:protoheme IX farnesyltransferase